MSSHDTAMRRVAALDPARTAIVDRDAAEQLLERVLATRLTPAPPATPSTPHTPTMPLAPRSRPRGHHRKAILALVAIALLALAAAALAAVGVIRFGAPARSPFALSSPRFGLGSLRPGSARVLSVSSADPAGGPPWGMRVLSTTRGVGCIEVGRVLHGRLGALGEDGAFDDDGRFHEFPARGLLGGAVCANLDAHGRLFDTVGSDVLPASGDTGDGSCIAPPPPGEIIVGPNASRICPAADVRVLSYGLLGPDARGVTYTLDGHQHTLVPVAPEGAYLIVNGYQRGRRLLGEGSSGASITPLPWSSPIETITYSNGTVCHIADTRPGTLAGKCRPPGYVPVTLRRPTHAQVAATIHASIVVAPPARAAELGTHRAIRVSFTARVAVTKAADAYELVEATSSPEAVFTETRQDISPGQTVSWLLPARRPGTYSGTVRLGIGVSPAYPIYSYSPGPPVGRFSIRVP
jgi:hypothetical protein